MGQTLTNGIYLPDEGERNCYTGLAANWRALDYLIGGYNVHVDDAVIHVTQADRNKWDAVTGKADSSALTAHTGDTTIHVTAEDKTNWDGKANDADAVHKSGAETIPGAKTFSTFITSDGSSTGDEYSGTAKTNLWLMGNRDTEEVSGVLFDTFRQNTAQGTGTHIFGISIKENAVRYEGCRFSWIWDNNLNGYSFSIRPTLQGANQAVEHCIGLSTDKWDKINGVSPGALSLPDLTAGVDISGYLTNAGTTTPSEYTPTVDGWLVLAISADSPAFIRVFSTAGIDATAYSERNEFGSTSGGTYSRYAALTVPCRQNDKQNIIIMPSTMGIVKAMFYPCKGNV